MPTRQSVKYNWRSSDGLKYRDALNTKEILDNTKSITKKMDSEIYITSEMIPDISKLLNRAAEISNIRKAPIGTRNKNKRPSARKK